MGKSRLLAEFAHRLDGQPVTVLRRPLPGLWQRHPVPAGARPAPPALGPPRRSPCAGHHGHRPAASARGRGSVRGRGALAAPTPGRARGPGAAGRAQPRGAQGADLCAAAAPRSGTPVSSSPSCSRWKTCTGATRPRKSGWRHWWSGWGTCPCSCWRPTGPGISRPGSGTQRRPRWRCRGCRPDDSLAVVQSVPQAAQLPARLQQAIVARQPAIPSLWRS